VYTVEWSREMLLDAWMTNAVACCEKSGVSAPANLFSDEPVVAESLSTPTMTTPPSAFAEVIYIYTTTEFVPLWIGGSNLNFRYVKYTRVHSLVDR